MFPTNTNISDILIYIAINSLSESNKTWDRANELWHWWYYNQTFSKCKRFKLTMWRVVYWRYFKWGWNKTPFDINSVVFHFDDFNYGRWSQPYCFWLDYNYSCIIMYNNLLLSLSHKVGVFLEEAICYFIYAKFTVMFGF
jgi:hypothetical protein